MATVNMIAPSGVNAGPVQCRSGNSYTIDANRYVASVNALDVNDLLGAGFTMAPLPYAKGVLLGTLLLADMNVTTDQPIVTSLAGLAPAGTRWRLSEVRVTGASISLTTAAGGFYTAASKGGTAVVANSQAYSGLTVSTSILACTIAAAGLLLTFADAATIYFALTTAQGAAATANIRLFGDLLG